MFIIMDDGMGTGAAAVELVVVLPGFLIIVLVSVGVGAAVAAAVAFSRGMASSLCVKGCGGFVKNPAVINKTTILNKVARSQIIDT